MTTVGQYRETMGFLFRVDGLRNYSLHRVNQVYGPRQLTDEQLEEVLVLYEMGVRLQELVRNWLDDQRLPEYRYDLQRALNSVRRHHGHLEDAVAQNAAVQLLFLQFCVWKLAREADYHLMFKRYTNFTPLLQLMNANAEFAILSDSAKRETARFQAVWNQHGVARHRRIVATADLSIAVARYKIKFPV